MYLYFRGSEIPGDLSVNYPKVHGTQNYFSVLFLKSRSEQNRFRFVCYPSKRVDGRLLEPFRSMGKANTATLWRSTVFNQ